MYILTANYRDRASERKWLLRDAAEPAEKAVEVYKTEAFGVKFVSTFMNANLDDEEGFGCSIAALCEKAGPYEGVTPEGMKRLVFTGYEFLEFTDDGPAGSEVIQVERLVLLSDGRILADGLVKAKE